MQIIRSFVPRRARRRRASQALRLIMLAGLIVWLPAAIIAACAVLAP